MSAEPEYDDETSRPVGAADEGHSAAPPRFAEEQILNAEIVDDPPAPTAPVPGGQPAQHGARAPVASWPPANDPQRPGSLLGQGPPRGPAPAPAKKKSLSTGCLVGLLAGAMLFGFALLLAVVAGIGFVAIQRARQDAEAARLAVEEQQARAEAAIQQLKNEAYRESQTAPPEFTPQNTFDPTELANQPLPPGLPPKNHPGFTPDGGLRLSFQPLDIPVAEMHQSIAGDDLSRDGHKITRLALEAASIVAEPVWSVDGDYLYLAMDNGRVMQLDISDLAWTRQIQLASNAASMAISSEGLVVTGDSTTTIYVIEEGTLARQRSMLFPNVGRVVGSRNSPVVFVQPVTTFPGAGLQAIDLAKEQSRVHVEVGWTDLLAMTPDGKYLFAVENGGLLRYAVQGQDLTLEQRGPAIASDNPQRVEVSGDSRWVAVPCGGGNRVAENHSPLNYGTYIYDVANLLSPVASIEAGAYPRAIAFDPRHNRIYAENFEITLRIYNPSSEHLGDLGLAERGDEVRFMTVHPAGGKLLVITGRHGYWIELNADE